MDDHPKMDIITHTVTACLCAVFLQRSVVGGKKPSIYSFVEAGKDYLSKLTKYMMALLYFTPLYHDDHNHLGRIVDGETLSLCTHALRAPYKS